METVMDAFRYRYEKVIGLASVLLILSGASSAVQVGESAPGFSLPTYAKETLKSEALAGKLVYIDFWASWCAPCKQSFPWMNEMQQKYGAQGLRVVAINVDKRREDADRFLRLVPARFTVAFDPDGLTPKQFAVAAMPSSYLIDHSGRIVFSRFG
jgi:cytochrome c biogenesis protein CcmG, thiol:disulfide interchange protein DsbE